MSWMSTPGAVGSIRSAALAGLALLLSACGLGTPALRGDDGQLQACSKANCVSSLSDDASYAVEPLRYTGTAASAHQRLLQVLATMPRIEVREDTPAYVHATATTALMRYVDDLEFVFAEDAPLIQLRSASRLGYSDFGVNRERMQQIRARFEAAP